MTINEKTLSKIIEKFDDFIEQKGYDFLHKDLLSENQLRLRPISRTLKDFLQSDLFKQVFTYDNVEERILCAAMYYENLEYPEDKYALPLFLRPMNIDRGVVVLGHRHHNCIHTANAIFGEKISLIEDVDGFLTSKNRFVDRIEGLEIAKRNNQIIIEVNDKSRLYSDNLY